MHLSDYDHENTFPFTHFACHPVRRDRDTQRQGVTMLDFDCSQQTKNAWRRLHQDGGALADRYRGDDPGYYSTKIVRAAQDPTAAGPRLKHAMAIWNRIEMSLATEEGEPNPAGWDSMLRRLRAFAHAIDQDDVEAENSLSNIDQRLARLEAAHTSQETLFTEFQDRLAKVLERSPAIGTTTRVGLSPDDAAECLGVETPAIENLMKSRKLAYVQVGEQRGRVILVEDLVKFARERRQPTGEEMKRKRKPRGG
jgi:hypothetical protein